MTVMRNVMRPITRDVMFGPLAKFGGGPGSEASDYDGSTRFNLTGGLTGVANGKIGSASFWLNLPDIVGNHRTLAMGSSSRFVMNIIGSSIRATGFNTAGTLILQLINTGASLVADTWHHLAFSWDLGAGAGTGRYFLDGVDRKNEAVYTDDIIDYNQNDDGFGASSGGGQILDGCISEFWFDLVYVDFAVAANLQEFRTAGGDPAPINADGSTATLSQPLCYYPDGDASDNKGTGGPMILAAGALTPCATTPG